MAKSFVTHGFARTFAFACLFAWQAEAFAAAPEAPETQGDHRAVVQARIVVEEACIAALLRRIVDDDANARGPQRLYVGPRTTENATTIVRAYWPQARAIVLIDPAAVCDATGAPVADIDLGWYRTKARIDLDTDVVATPEDIAGSTYLVDRAWVDAVIAECLRSEPLTIAPMKRKRSKP